MPLIAEDSPLQAITRAKLEVESRGTPPCGVVCSPRAERAIEREFGQCQTASVYNLFGIKVFSKNDQKRDAWMFTDTDLLLAYLGNRVSEDNLEQLEAAMPDPSARERGTMP